MDTNKFIFLQDDYAARLPPIEQLLSEFHVHADIAFFLARPMFNHMITTKYDEECPH